MHRFRYHHHRLHKSRRAGRSFAAAGALLFALVVLVVAAKLWLVITEASTPLTTAFGLAAAIIPTFAAASVGIRAYAELELLVDQSRHMREAMGVGGAFRRLTPRSRWPPRSSVARC